MRAWFKRLVPNPVKDLVRLWRLWPEYPAAAKFLSRRLLLASFLERLSILRRLFLISMRLPSPHVQDEVFSFAQTILSLPPDVPGVCVEAGCFKGSSTAKFSLAADLAGRDLVVFDSFCGIPRNEELHTCISGEDVRFFEGLFCGTYDEVVSNVTKYGKINRCRFIQGWLEDTMPGFHEPIAAAYIDVDLVSSTKTCLKYLYPLLHPDGVLYSQDGHLQLVVDVFNDDNFWENEVGCKKPQMLGLGTSRLIAVFKGARPNAAVYAPKVTPRP
jgi:O-methyltransferase